MSNDYWDTDYDDDYSDTDYESDTGPDVVQGEGRDDDFPVEGGEGGGGTDLAPNAVRNEDGSITYTYDDGSTLTTDADGNPIGSTDATDGGIGGGGTKGTGGTGSAPKTTADIIKKLLKDPKALAGLAGGLYGAYQSTKEPPRQGYQGKIPTYEAVQTAVPGAMGDTTRRPGSGGQRYLSSMHYAAPADAAAARSVATGEATGLEALNKANPMRGIRPSPTDTVVEQGGASEAVRVGEDPSKVIERMPVPTYAHGGIMSLAGGGRGRYLDGATDGMADKIPARIDGSQEAKLSHGEFVVSADVVSALGGGNSEAGAKRLYDMMDRIRTAAHGRKKQINEVNPRKVLPA